MIQEQLKVQLAQALFSLYQHSISADKVVIESTTSDFEGDFTFVVFPYLKVSRKNPEQTATEIGVYLQENFSLIKSHQVIKGFLNLSIDPSFWVNFLQTTVGSNQYGFAQANSKEAVLLEYSSPNTNKPLHLGHIRNNLLGYSVAEILKANGNRVFTCNLVNDRGIHICKSMYAWMHFGNGETPESSGLKGDHLVGKYYVVFDKHYKKEMEELRLKGMSEEESAKKAPCILAAQDLLVKWEANDPEVVGVWKMMNDWVYSGFDVTYKKLGVSFDKYYYESNTYLLGKEIVQEGLEKNVFFKKDDGSVWIDLTEDGLDQKLVLRGDGTSVYITQDLGTADIKFNDFNCNRSIYVVGNEQEYHFKVLQLIALKLGKSYAPGIFHLSYGMVELPHGKMKSREGTVVDADDLIAEMEHTAAETTKALGKMEGETEENLNTLYHTIGMGALKYYLLKVDPKKKMMFNPEESIDFQGNTGPFIQYTHARICSILRNVGSANTSYDGMDIVLSKVEKELLVKLYQYPLVIAEAAKDLSPGVVCNYVYDLAKTFSIFYHDHSILKETNEAQKAMRIEACRLSATVIKSSFALLGIAVPEKM
ncbi:MAG: arginine--tRNA ligase [Bacteroidetes bacterium B1(2017)]|nr:MAG: arginine--tRNA ligase [Bacteroidetes bacterium B1(2017)]